MLMKIILFLEVLLVCVINDDFEFCLLCGENK